MDVEPNEAPLPKSSPALRSPGLEQPRRGNAGSPDPATSRRARVLDALGAVCAFATGAALWAADRGDGALVPADSPAWARIRDHLLEGPDAGAWASNAVALWQGRIEDLDPHRLPILPYLTAFVLRFEPDPALSGHLVNHLLHLTLGPVVFLLGRRWMGRGMALGAALTAVCYPPGVLAAERYGVDPLVAFALPTALLAAEAAARRALLAPLFGVVVGLAASAHLTTIGLAVPAVLLTLLRGTPGPRRWLGALGLAGGALLGVGMAFMSYPTLPWDLLVGSVAEGVSPNGLNANAVQLDGAMERAVTIVTAGGPAAIERVIAFCAATTRPAWLPWGAALALPWLGALGLGLSAPPETPSGRVRWAVRGLAAGLPLAVALGPLLAFAAADSPPRYTSNYYPLVALLMFRGAAVVVGAIEAAASRVWPTVLPSWTRGGLGLVVGLAMAWSLWSPARVLTPLRMPPTMVELTDWRLGAALREHFPPGGGAACLRREVIAYAGRVYCPYTPGFDYRLSPEPVRAHLDAECPGTGDIPYVVLSGVADGTTEARRRTDAWIEANATLVERFEGEAYTADIYAMARPAADTAERGRTP